MIVKFSHSRSRDSFFLTMPAFNEASLASPSAAQVRASPALVLPSALQQGFMRVLQDFFAQMGEHSAFAQHAQEMLHDGAPSLQVTQWLVYLEALPQRLKRPALGLELGRALQPQHLGPAGQVLIHCSSLGDAVERLGRYTYFWGDLGRSGIHQQGDWVHDLLEWPALPGYPMPPAIVEQMWAAATVNLARELTGRADLVWQAEFCFAQPAQSQAYADFFGCMPRFGASTAQLIFPASYLQLPIRMGNLALRQLAQSQADAAMQREGEAQTLRAQIYEQFDAALAACKSSSFAAQAKDQEPGAFHQDTVAAKLGISSRTLHRHLAQQNLRFRQVLDDWRFEQAKVLLLQPDCSLNELASRLGYAEQSNFQHAFKRWSGFSPGAFRAMLLAR